MGQASRNEGLCLAGDTGEILYCAMCGAEGATLVCAKCGLTLCFQCVETIRRELTVCQACGSFKISQGRKGKLFCMTCSGENIGRGLKIQRRCPTCSGEVQNISQVKKEVVSRFLDVMKVFKGIGIQFVKLCANWEHLRIRIEKLRRANYYHYAILEEKMASIYDILPEEGRFVFSQVAILAEKLKAEAAHLLGSSFRSLNKVGKKMQQLVSLEKELEIVSDKVTERLRIEQESLDHLTQLVKKMESFRNYFDQLHDVLPLNPFEFPIMVLPRANVSNFITVNGNKSNGAGAICLTTSRLAFITKKGRFHKVKHVKNLHINQVAQVSKKQKKRKLRLIITTTLGTIEIQSKKEVIDELYAFLDMARSWNAGKIPIAQVGMTSIKNETKKYRERLSNLWLDILKSNKEILDESKPEYFSKKHIDDLEKEISVLWRTLRGINENFDRGYIPAEKYTQIMLGLISDLDRLQWELTNLNKSAPQRLTPSSGLEKLFGGI